MDCQGTTTFIRSNVRAEKAKQPRSMAMATLAALGVFLMVGCSGNGDGQGALASEDDVSAATTTLGVEASAAETSESMDTAGADEPRDDSSSPPTTTGSGLPPVTTVPGPAGGDPENIYKGVLGGLGVDEQIAEPVTDPPEPSEDILPLTGLPGSIPDRPAAVVKIDNGPAAGPQTGLNAADIVIEEEVEGGVTRFAAIFHSTPSIVGPVRSGRTSDVALVSSLGEPLYLYSGANDITEMIVRGQTAIRNRSYSSSSGYWRDETRQAPSNVYTDTAPHWASADGGPPPQQFSYRAAGTEVSRDTSAEFAIAYPASPVRWTWNESQWIRHQRGKQHELVSGEAVAAANVLVVELDRVATGMVDSAGGQVPESVFVGSGPVTVFVGDQRIEGRWTRPTLASVATLTDSNGEVIELEPGRTWIQLIELGSGALQ